jgi:PII-like signaling protein
MPWISGRSARILTHERARAGHRSVLEATLALARRASLAASVTRAQEGWSEHGGARVASQVELSDDLPLIIEIVGATERIEAALPDLIALAATHGTITLTETRLWMPDEALRP